MRFSLKRVVCFILAVYFLVTCYTFYKLLQRKTGMLEDDVEHSSKGKVQDDGWNPWGEDFRQEGRQHQLAAAPVNLNDPQQNGKDGVQEEIEIDDHWLVPKNSRRGRDTSRPRAEEPEAPGTSKHVVEIWGKAAIGTYLWQHIFRGKLEAKLGGIWSYGEESVQNVAFRFRTGPGVVPAKVPQDVRDLVIVLNGRESSKVEFSTVWLNYLTSSLPKLRNVAVVLLGNEMCMNSWIESYLQKNGGLVKAVFVTYDSKDVDNVNFFQWPLGVATYRGFPLVNPQDLPVRTQRQYQCNFLGTVYPGSSREALLRVIDQHNLHRWCYVNPRYEWLPGETQESRQEYYHAMLHSDFTLHPVGKNTECYRLYEAMAYGSIPIVENRMTTGNCGNNTLYENAPLRLLKQYHAPVIYVYDWRELPAILDKYRKVKVEEIIERRVKVLDWYDKFQTQVRDQFVSTIKNKFFENVERRGR